MDTTLPMSFNVIQYHSRSSLTVTLLSCQQRLPLLDLDLLVSLSLSLPLPLDEPVLIDAKEDKELAPSSKKEQKGLQLQNTHTMYKY